MSAIVVTHNSLETAPTTWDEFFRDYYGYVVRLVGRFGINQEDCEDIAMTVLAKFYERRALETFDPNYEGRNDQKVQFRSFLSGFVEIYVRHHRDRQVKRSMREGIYIDSFAEVLEAGAHPFYAPAYEEHYEDLEVESTLKTIRDYLRSVPARNRNDRASMTEFFDALLSHIEENDERVNIAQLARELGVARNTVVDRLTYMRTLIREALAE